VFGFSSPPVTSGMLNHVQPIIDGLPAELTLEQRQRAIGLIHANADVFSTMYLVHMITM